jgi:hypothetical protein
MDRFDRKFNDVDPITFRPFSAGHPDGVWVGAIVYGLLIVVPLIALIVVSVIGLLGGAPNYDLLLKLAVMLVINIIFFLPGIIFAFRRSGKTIGYTFFLLFLFVLIAMAVYSYQPQFVIIPLIVVLLQGYNCWYLLELKKDSLLT